MMDGTGTFLLRSVIQRLIIVHQGMVLVVLLITDMIVAWQF